MGFEINEKGQVTIFIIVGIVIAAGIFGVIYFAGDIDADAPADLGPKAFVDKCIRDAVEESIDKILFNGGEISPTQTIMYQGGGWNYLCYQADFAMGCYNLHPMLEMQIEEEIEEDTRVDVRACFDSMNDDFESRGFDVNVEMMTYSIDLLPGYVAINLDKKIDISKGGTAQSFRDFDTRVSSAIYDLVRIARDVVNSESQYCNFEHNGYMILYPRYDIRRIAYMNSRIYRLIDRMSGEEFRFAVRSCAIPPGSF